MAGEDQRELCPAAEPPQPPGGVSGGLPPQAAAREDPRPELWDAVLSLPRDQRAAVGLYYYEDMPVADIASLLRVPAGTVKSRLSRARDKLRLALSDPQVTRKEERT